MGLDEERQRFVDHVYQQLTGRNLELPDDQLTGENPLDRFVTGFLFPVFEAEEGIDDDQNEAGETSESDDESVEATKVTKRKRYIPRFLKPFLDNY